MNPNKALWEKGDFTEIAALMRQSGEGVVKSLEITPPLRVLDLGCGDGTTDLPADTDVIVIHAGASHVRPEWLACMAPAARLLVPLTVAMPAMGATLGKGVAFVITRATSNWRAKALSFVAIYSMVSARDETLAAVLGQALQHGGWDQVTWLRVDSHDRDATCWCHWEAHCLS